MLVKQQDIFKNYYVYDKDIVFKKVKNQKQQSLGMPIDCSTKKGKEKAIDALMKMDKTYLIEEDDLEIFDFSLSEIKKYFKPGYRMQNVAYGVKKYVLA